MKKKDRSIRYINMNHAFLSTFFTLNGFKNGRTLEIETYHLPARYRKKAEYIPTNAECWELIYAAGSPMNQAILSACYTSGLRNSTIRALLYQDVKDELEAGKEIIKIPVYPEMKKIIPDACKNSIPYFSFISKEAVRLLRNYVAYAQSKYGEIKDSNPLFIGERFQGRLTFLRSGTVEAMIHRAGFKANLPKWKDVTPKCLRTAFQNLIKSEFADGKGRMDEKDQLFLMGHISPGSEDHYYDATKMESLRAQYARLPFDTFPSSVEVEEKLAAKTSEIEGVKKDMAHLKRQNELVIRVLQRFADRHGTEELGKIFNEEETKASPSP